MREFPQELFMAFAFAAVLLVQFVYRQLRQKALSMQAQHTPQAEAPAAALPPAPAPARAAAPQKSAEAAPAATPTRAARAASQIWRDPERFPDRVPSRFSRPALMPDRRAVQDAIVIATILRPCHAQRPHEVE